MKRKILGGGSDEEDCPDDPESLKESDMKNDAENHSNESVQSEKNDDGNENDENENKEGDTIDSSTVVISDNDTGNESASKGDTSTIEDNGKTEEDEDEDSTHSPTRRSSTRLRNSGKRPKLTELPSSSDEEDESDEDMRYEKKDKDRKRSKKTYAPKSKLSPRSRGRPKRKSDAEPSKTKDTPSESKTNKKTEENSTKPPKEFASGAFVVLKSDFHAGTTPAIWKIDGKALLQKYAPFEQDGQTLYKNTSTYSGWTPNNKDQYYPATVDFKSQNRKETVVKFMRDLIVADDSDE